MIWLGKRIYGLRKEWKKIGKHGDDDLQFLYLSINVIRSSNPIREIHLNDSIIFYPSLLVFHFVITS